MSFELYKINEYAICSLCEMHRDFFLQSARVVCQSKDIVCADVVDRAKVLQHVQRE